MVWGFTLCVTSVCIGITAVGIPCMLVLFIMGQISYGFGFAAVAIAGYLVPTIAMRLQDGYY